MVRRMSDVTIKGAATPARAVVEDYTHRIFRQYKIKNVIDAGANIGGYVYTWLELGATRVHAIEPEPTSYATLAARYAGDARVKTHKLGVSDAPDDLRDVNVYNCWTLKPEADRTLDRALEFVGKPPFDVKLTTIDELCGVEHFVPDFIKIDVDGYDAKALRGARRTLTEHRPVVMLEVSYLPFFVDDCCECMIRGIFALGYTITSTSIAEPGKVYKDAREFMRTYPWDTSYDVLLEPGQR